MKKVIQAYIGCYRIFKGSRTSILLPWWLEYCTRCLLIQTDNCGKHLPLLSTIYRSCAGQIIVVGRNPLQYRKVYGDTVLNICLGRLQPTRLSGSRDACWSAFSFFGSLTLAGGHAHTSEPKSLAAIAKVQEIHYRLRRWENLK